jgi:hypothetical protein
MLESAVRHAPWLLEPKQTNLDPLKSRGLGAVPGLPTKFSTQTSPGFDLLSIVSRIATAGPGDAASLQPKLDARHTQAPGFNMSDAASRALDDTPASPTSSSASGIESWTDHEDGSDQYDDFSDFQRQTADGLWDARADGPTSSVSTSSLATSGTVEFDTADEWEVESQNVHRDASKNPSVGTAHGDAVAPTNTRSDYARENFVGKTTISSSEFDEVGGNRELAEPNSLSAPARGG